MPVSAKPNCPQPLPVPKGTQWGGSRDPSGTAVLDSAEGSGWCSLYQEAPGAVPGHTARSGSGSPLPNLGILGKGLIGEGRLFHFRPSPPAFPFPASPGMGVEGGTVRAAALVGPDHSQQRLWKLEPSGHTPTPDCPQGLPQCSPLGPSQAAWGGLRPL